MVPWLRLSSIENPRSEVKREIQMHKSKNINVLEMLCMEKWSKIFYKCLQQF